MIESFEKLKIINSIINTKNIELSIIEKTNIKDLVNGDIVIFNYGGKEPYYHIGIIYGSNGYFEIFYTKNSRCNLNENILIYKLKTNLLL